MDIHMTFLNVFCRLSAEIKFFLFHQLYTEETKVMPATRADAFMPCYSCRSCGKFFFHFCWFQLNILLEWRNSRRPEAGEMVLYIFSPGVSSTSNGNGDGS